MRRAILVALGLLLAAATGAAAEPRLALVVGNSAYERLGALRNPGKDADLIASTLREVGFEVTTAKDLTRADFLRAVRKFAGEIEEAGRDTVAVLFFAGHGIQFRGDNYLIPVRSDLRTQRDLPIEAIWVDDILRTIEEAQPKMTFVILDACRDNPLPAGPSGTRSAKRGLAAMVQSPGVIIAFSTGPNSTAEDGAGDHSHYSRALAEAMPLPGLEVEQIFKKVRIAVSEATRGEQIPWENGKLTSTFHFVPPNAPRPPTSPPAAMVAAPTVAAPPQPKANLGQDPTLAYHQAVQKDTAEAYHEVIAKFPDHPQRELIERLLQRSNEERLWAQAEVAEGKAALRTLDRLFTAYPDGVYSERARKRIIELRRAASRPPTSSPAAMVAAPTVAAPPQPKASPGQDPTLAYHQAVQKDTVEAYDEVLAKFPNHPQRDLISRLLQRKSEEKLWTQAEQTVDKHDALRKLELLVTAYPDGDYSQRARQRIIELREVVDASTQSLSEPGLPSSSSDSRD